MKPILVIYATREGHTRRIAEYLGERLHLQNQPFDLVDAAHIPEDYQVTTYSAAILAASLHVGKYEPEMTKFVKSHRAELQQIPTVFLSVSLAETTAEDLKAPPEKRLAAQGEVQRTIDRFLAATGWRPSRTTAVAGALPYSKYNFAIRFVMKLISKSAGGPSDTSRDYVFTDWTRLAELAEQLVQMVSAKGHAESEPMLRAR